MELAQIGLEHSKRMALQDQEFDKVQREYDLWEKKQA